MKVERRTLMGRHLTIKDRVILQYQIEKYSNVSVLSLSEDLNVDPSTIYRELKKKAVHHTSKKERYLHQKPRMCPKMDSFPFVCNPCAYKTKCSMALVFYDAYEADKQAHHLLKDSRCHPHHDTLSLNILNERVSPRVKCHQSLYHILQSDLSITVSESTLRRYIDHQYLDCRNIDLPRTIRFPHAKTSTQVHRKRVNIEFLVNRTYQDYRDYTRHTPRTTLQLDTVIGKLSDHLCLLTLYEPSSKFQWGYLISKTAISVNNVLSTLIETLRSQHRLFFDCLLCDNGAEFQFLPHVETTPEGEILCRVFYCDPYSSFQKGGCERNHALIRYVIKKGESLDSSTQEEINLLFSHINSQKRKSLSGKTPFKAFRERFHFLPSDFVPVLEILPSQLRLTK